MKSKKSQSSISAKLRRNIVPVVVLCAVALMGIVLGVTSHAATASVSAEVENSTVSSPATTITDTTASGGKAIKFGAGN